MHVFIAVLLWILWILAGVVGLALAFVVVSLAFDAIGRRKMLSCAWPTEAGRADRRRGVRALLWGRRHGATERLLEVGCCLPYDRGAHRGGLEARRVRREAAGLAGRL